MKFLLDIFGPVREGSTKTIRFKYLLAILLVFGVPTLLYLLIRYEPIINYDSYGDPVYLYYGSFAFFVLYWLSLIFAYKGAKYHSQLKGLLQKITTKRGVKEVAKIVETMSEEDEDDNLFYDDGDIDMWLDRFKIK